MDHETFRRLVEHRNFWRVRHMPDFVKSSNNTDKMKYLVMVDKFPEISEFHEHIWLNEHGMAAPAR